MTSDPTRNQSAGSSGGPDFTLGRDEGDRRRFAAVQSYADRVLETGRDRWSGEDTPLLADGAHVDSRDPVIWRYDDEEFVVSNMASQQNLFRALVGLSRLTTDSTYEDAARAAIAYHFDHLADESGLLRWGGHQFVDLATLNPIGRFDADVHEFKTHFPYYDLMWEVNPEATTQFLRAVWDAHILDWAKLDMNRHGEYGDEVNDIWNHEFADPEPFFDGNGLSFVNIGSDLIWAAGNLRALRDETEAWTWGMRLARMYEKARHPETGLGAYQYTRPHRRDHPPEEGPLPTTSNYGDRAENQFGAQFGEVAREGWVMWGDRVRTLYVRNGLMQLGLADRLGEAGAQLRRWTVDRLATLADHAYAPDENAFRPMWADGTDLTEETYDRTGYYGEAGRQWEILDADAGFLLAYARAYRLSNRTDIWETARAMADGLGVGDIGAAPGDDPTLESSVGEPTPEEVFALLELYWAVGNPTYINRARRVANRLVEQRYHHGFFLPSRDHVYARFDAVEPLALLALDATLRGRPEAVPAYPGGSGYVHGRFDGHGRIRDTTLVWPTTRDHEDPLRE